ncbi:MAG: 23S rRNA (guanosine(2251)-2'-O)-methyltransferase RlmB [Candidatus Viridilinea halotolerans]|uniref:23S rRNA (Guanosine(2251)-2'-O)-methyltransferase RlmB n=1 Tax=Candidatus Viridilinea halotolerans TaxID=2491704 RepID=A0A426UAM7_9CHLR|nr:MAG: 23S rRNA (guanosine(2251)-2'-O)-methyltransferase RlmB [Candidatus Viridilinea halotolerans]
MNELLYGRNAVREALRARRRELQRLTISSGVQETGVVAELVRLAEAAEVAVQRVERQALDRQLRDANHQGVMLETGPYPYVDLEECLALAAERQEPPLLLLLDHLQDPQNVGTLLRTAEVVGAHGVVMPGRRAAEITPAVVNASSGATEHLRVAMVVNLAQTIVELQKEGVWVVGVEDEEAARPFDTTDLNMPLALVVGAEGAGLARLVRERCDFLVRLPMVGQLASLNAAVAGSIALYGAWRQRFAA